MPIQDQKIIHGQGTVCWRGVCTWQSFLTFSQATCQQLASILNTTEPVGLLVEMTEESTEIRGERM